MNKSIAGNVVFFLGFQNPFPGAAWRRIDSFAKAVREKGYNTYVIGSFSLRSLGRFKRSEEKAMKIFNFCPFIALDVWLVNILNMLLSTFYMGLLFLFVRPKLTVISVPPVEIGVGAYFAGRLSNSRVIFDYRDDCEDYKVMGARSKFTREFYSLFRSFMTSLYKKSECLITVTQPFANSLKQRGIWSTRLIPNGADLKVFKCLGQRERLEIRRKHGFDPDDFIYIYSGLVVDTESYTPSTLIHAFRMITNDIPKAKLVLMGPPPPKYSASLFDWAKPGGQVRYLGLLAKSEDVSKVLAMCDVGVIPYADTREPYLRYAIPAKFYEYCACRLPVIATVYENSELARIIQEKKIGLICPPENIEKLAEGMTEICRNWSYRELAGRRSRLMVEKHFDRNLIVRDFVGLVKSLMSVQ